MSTLESGRRVGRYQIVRFLGAGAMGEVYLAEDPHIERRLAIKTVRLAGGRPQDIEDRKKRLLREARAAGRLLHPNVVALFDAGEEDGLLYLAFEFVEGCDLAGRLESSDAPTLREVLRIVRQVAEALDYAHRQGIVHRDIKPSNILIDAAGHVKVADFGIAKVVGQNTELTVAGSVMGSPQYLSPEQIRGDELDGRSDIFSLGVVLYELLSGRRPFDGETITTLVYQILHKDPSIAELRAVPLRIEQLLHRMLAKDREQRLSTAGLVAEELAAIERELPEETLAAPAAPADAGLDATRVLPSRAVPPLPPLPSGSPGAAPSPALAAAASGSAGARLPGGDVAPGAPATGAALQSAPVAGAATGAPVSGMAIGTSVPGAASAPLPAATASPLAASAAVGPPGAPGAAPATPGWPAAAQGSPAAPGPAPMPSPARRSSAARIWLALAALLLVLGSVLAVGAYWFWQRYLRPAAAASAATQAATSTPAAAPGASDAGGAAAPAASSPSAAAIGQPASAAGTPAPATRGVLPSPPAAAAQPEQPPGSRQTRAAGAVAAPPLAGGTTGSSAPVRSAPPGPAGATSGAGGAPQARLAAATPGQANAPRPRGERQATAAGGGEAPGSRLAAATGAAADGSARGGAGREAAVAAPRTVPASPPAAAAATAPPVPMPPQPAAADGMAQEASGPAAGAASAGSGSITADGADRVLHSGLELSFRVNPADAFVLLDGAVIGRAVEWSGQKGGRSFTLPGAGAHVVKIKKPGMKDYRITVEASATRGVTPVVVNLQPLPAAQVDTPDLQTIRVREAVALHVQPDVNAVVLVDGSAAGPVKRFAGRFGHADEWLSLAPGTHRVTLIAPGYSRRDLAVEVSPGADRARQKIDVALVREAGN